MGHYSQANKVSEKEFCKYCRKLGPGESMCFRKHPELITIKKAEMVKNVNKDADKEKAIAFTAHKCILTNNTSLEETIKIIIDSGCSNCMVPSLGLLTHPGIHQATVLESKSEKLKVNYISHLRSMF
jgi:hypothetical protein